MSNLKTQIEQNQNVVTNKITKKNSVEIYTKFIGRKINRLKIIKLYRNPVDKALYFECQCECNKVKDIRAYSVVSGNVKSCGCLFREKMIKYNFIHGLSSHPLFRTWVSMMQRCYNPKNKQYKYYGGRGIKVCKDWLDPRNFINDMSPRPAGAEIDRYPNNDGDYEPNNCRWATRKQQMNNFKRNRWIEFNGERLTLTEWARKIGIKENTLIYRIDVAKWSLEKALTTPKLENSINNILKFPKNERKNSNYRN